MVKGTTKIPSVIDIQLPDGSKVKAKVVEAVGHGSRGMTIQYGEEEMCALVRSGSGGLIITAICGRSIQGDNATLDLKTTKNIADMLQLWSTVLSNMVEEAAK